MLYLKSNDRQSENKPHNFPINYWAQVHQRSSKTSVVHILFLFREASSSYFYKLGHFFFSHFPFSLPTQLDKLDFSFTWHVPSSCPFSMISSSFIISWLLHLKHCLLFSISGKFHYSQLQPFEEKKNWSAPSIFSFPMSLCCSHVKRCSLH